MHREAVSLADYTTLRLGGPARRFFEADAESSVVDAISEADARGERVFLLGGGSNIVVSDSGFDGLVVRIVTRGITAARDGERVRVDVAAGEPWDGFVAHAVNEGWSGVECLSGIPGLVGATPIQNVGAYGQEVRDTIASVRVFDRASRSISVMDRDACRFTYRHSVFKGTDRYIVLGVTFVFDASNESAPITYAELSRALSIPSGTRAPLARTRETVIALRRTKGMVVDASDPDSISAGSFFTNPILDDAAFADLTSRVASKNLGALPRFDADGGLHKVSAAWLIEKSGFTKGYGARAAISRKHALALVNRDHATTRELLALAREIQNGVRATFGVDLAMEPVLVGF